MAALALLLFAILFLLILRGYPVAYTLGGLATLCGIILMYTAPQYFSASDFHLLGSRIFGIMNNYVLLAVPLFIFMGIMLEKSGLAERMLNTMSALFGHMRGGLAVSVIVVGALLAASTGIVGATVVTMGLISLPTLLDKGYAPSFASGTIAASGTLGQIIPPSIVLVILADTISNASRTSTQVDVGAMFGVALLPGFLLVGLYILYVIGLAYVRKGSAGAVLTDKVPLPSFRSVVLSFALPFLLILAVLGSIFWGLASPTEAAAVGAIGAILLTVLQGRFSIQVLREVSEQTTRLTSMVFMILLGATTFSLLFRTLGGDALLVQLLQEANLPPYAFLLLVMAVIFVVGFFIDFIEIVFIIVPVVTPLFELYEFDLLWVGLLIALNLQTSFLTPPFGFSLFYLKGVAPPGVRTQDIYRGVIPFVIIQILFIGIIAAFPNWFIP